MLLYSDLQEMGFSNIILKRSDDLKTGWINKPGTIKSISIGGNKEFNASASFEFDEEIIIVVYTHKGKGYESITQVE